MVTQCQSQNKTKKKKYFINKHDYFILFGIVRKYLNVVFAFRKRFKISFPDQRQPLHQPVINQSPIVTFSISCPSFFRFIAQGPSQNLLNYIRSDCCVSPWCTAAPGKCQEFDFIVQGEKILMHFLLRFSILARCVCDLLLAGHQSRNNKN